MSYIEEAVETCSPHFFGEKVTVKQFSAAIKYAINALQELDAIKKQLFYNKTSYLLEPVEKDDLTCEVLLEGFNENPKDIIHAILGIATEAGELLEALDTVYMGSNCTFDHVNLKEEGGDLQWYQALLFKTIETTFEEVQQLNIAKLQKKRYKNKKFSIEEATERDLSAEREELESGVHSTGHVDIGRENVKAFKEELRDLGIEVKNATVTEFEASEDLKAGQTVISIEPDKIGAFDPLQFKADYGKNNDCLGEDQ
jgi:NTP pyrophosphatase (non-canonical NTP hydrolase)